jgi:hypothetical protein
MSVRPRIEAFGIAATLPAGIEGRIFRRSGSGGAEAYAVAQFASIALPPVSDVGDFGGGIVQLLGPDDVLVILFEYGPESLGTALFAREGLPRTIPGYQFHPYRLRRGMAGQVGSQVFFTEAGRPFTIYAVLGSAAQAAIGVAKVNALLARLSVTSVEPVA